MIFASYFKKNQYYSNVLISPLNNISTAPPFSSHLEKVKEESGSEEQIISLRGGGGDINSHIMSSVEKPLPTTRGRKLKEYKQRLKLSQRQKEVATGVMLGDASLQAMDNGKRYRLKFQGSQKHLEYGKALYREFEPFCLSPLDLFARTNENGNLVESWGFQTVGHEDFCSIADIFFDQPSSMESTSEKTQKSFKKNYNTWSG